MLKLEDGTPKASVFYVAYTKDDVSDTSKRPVTFTFNGGPGSASIWLHLGAFGPRRVEMGDAGALLPPPYKLVDNEYSLLDVTDLVFIDPVSTGYSRAVPGEAEAGQSPAAGRKVRSRKAVRSTAKAPTATSTGPPASPTADGYSPFSACTTGSITLDGNSMLSRLDNSINTCPN